MQSNEPPRESGREGAARVRQRRWVWLAATFLAATAPWLVLSFARKAPRRRPSFAKSGGTGEHPQGAPAQRVPVNPAASGPKVRVGDRLPDLMLRRADGVGVRLADYAGSLPLVLEFGSFT
jgi:hypothetical protein